MDKTQSIYEIIRKENVVKYGTHSSKVMQIIIGEYSDRTHFIYELLQNAEDAGATFVRFHLKKDKLLIVHNGRPFNEDDLRGVCGIADGTKEDGTRIGHFGIGFKSVYAYTDTPFIVSGDYSFHIDQYIFPVEENGDVDDSDLTYMSLPFNKENVLKAIRENRYFIMDYRLMIDGMPRSVYLKAAMSEDEDRPQIVIGVIDIGTQLK